MDVAAPHPGGNEPGASLRDEITRATEVRIMVCHIRNKLGQPRCAERVGMICARTNEIPHVMPAPCRQLIELALEYEIVLSRCAVEQGA